MVIRSRLREAGQGPNKKIRMERIAVRSTSDLGKAFWGSESGKTTKSGYTPQGIRDEIKKEGNVTNYYLWGNNIATFDANKNLLTVRDTGWKTDLTKDRLNNVLSEKFGYDTRISQERNVWYLEHKDKKYKWSDEDNKIDLSNPTKFFEPMEEKALTEKVKEQKEISDSFVKTFKDKIFKQEMTDEDFEMLHQVFEERGRPPAFAGAFLTDENGNWDNEKLKEHWNLIRMDLRGYARKKLERGEVPEARGPRPVDVGGKELSAWSTAIRPKPPFNLFVPSINEVPREVKDANKGKAFALGSFYESNTEALHAVKEAGYDEKKKKILKEQGYLKLTGEK